MRASEHESGIRVTQDSHGVLEHLNTMHSPRALVCAPDVATELLPPLATVELLERCCVPCAHSPPGPARAGLAWRETVVATHCPPPVRATRAAHGDGGGKGFVDALPCNRAGEKKRLRGGAGDARALAAALEPALLLRGTRVALSLDELAARDGDSERRTPTGGSLSALTREKVREERQPPACGSAAAAAASAHAAIARAWHRASTPRSFALKTSRSPADASITSMSRS